MQLNFALLTFFAFWLKEVLPQALVSYDATKYLVRNLETKLDTNMYFYFNHKRQRNSPHLCSSFDGPNCNLLNNKTLYGMEEKRSPFLKTQNIIPLCD